MDLYRPTYHFMPEKNWMNDPNGVIYYKGEYHLFYQHNPNAPYWDTIHWGHAKSKDLIHWQHLPVALVPSSELGEKHCFSGCAVINNGTPTIFYTSVGTGNRHQSVGAQQWMATSKDMVKWEKYPGNPVLTLDIHGKLDIREWRDPFIWKEDNTWYMVLGGSHDGKGCALLYKSANLLDWKFVGKLAEGDDYMWECPNFFRLGDKYVLIYSPDDQVQYQIGKFENEQFTPETQGTVDYSGWEGYYAPNSLEDHRGRRIMFGWLTETPRGDFAPDADWAGVQAIPRVLELDDKGQLLMEPIPEIQVLRESSSRFDGISLSGEWDSGIRGRALEIIAEFEIPPGEVEFGLKLFRSPGGEEETLVRLNPTSGTFAVDRRKSSLSDLPHKQELKGQLNATRKRTYRVHVLIDHSVVEVFVNGRDCISTRVYPTREDSDNVSLFASGDSVLLKSLAAWQIRSIWEK